MPRMDGDSTWVEINANGASQTLIAERFTLANLEEFKLFNVAGRLSHINIATPRGALIGVTASRAVELIENGERIYADVHQQPLDAAMQPVEAGLVANCPILVGHLNAMMKHGGNRADAARALVGILDDVESIAELIDHKFPADRHAMERARHIGECALQLQVIIPGTGKVSK